MQDYTIGKLTRTRLDGTRHWSYCIVWWEGDRRRRHSLGTTDRVAAEAQARRTWEEMVEGSALVTVGDIVGAYC